MALPCSYPHACICAPVLQILKPDGSVFSYLLVQRELSNAGIYVRAGCTCNPGVCYNHTGVTEEEVKDLATKMAKDGTLLTHWQWINVTRPGHKGPQRRPLGSLRASLGHTSRYEDVHALAKFIKATYVDRWDDDTPASHDGLQAQGVVGNSGRALHMMAAGAGGGKAMASKYGSWADKLVAWADGC